MVFINAFAKCNYRLKLRYAVNYLMFYLEPKCFKMYALIIYLEDDIYQVCLESTLKLRRNVVMGKFFGKYYPARIITTSGINFQIKNIAFH